MSATFVPNPPEHVGAAAPAKHSFTLSDFDFALPPELIAQTPSAERSGSRLLDGTQPNAVVDRLFRDLPTLFDPGDLLVFNDTRVMNARLFGHKASGGKVELLVERVLGRGEHGFEVVAHMKASKKPAAGAVLPMATRDGKSDAFSATLLGRWPDDQGTLFRFAFSDEPHALMAQHGHVPLPPYIEHADSPHDAERYQTVFAARPGAAAAPTAALHFDEALLQALTDSGVERAALTLHVGAGTFQPVKTENIVEHTMHSEWYEVPPATQRAVQAAEQRGARIVAVGTTTVRTLESWALTGQASGDTSIFITPGFEFKLVDRLITNFHLPKSTLLMLISAFAGYEQVMALYGHAVRERYRFFSYGDAMVLDIRRG
ncbi:MAG: tRNA preQ1(34) S-adenosylmethionine ribosyltransferase-isomerase QueA [Burkholderiaceae bacterium]